MEPLLKHQTDALDDGRIRLGKRLAAVSAVLDREPPAETNGKPTPAYIRRAWEQDLRDAYAACGHLLAHPMGSGKTATARREVAETISRWVQEWELAGVLHPTLKARLAKPRVLVVCPNSLKLNWQREWAMWSVNDEQAHMAVVDSKKQEFGMAMMYSIAGMADVTVMSYPTVRVRVNDGLLAVPWDIVIFDEIQELGSPDAQQTQAAYRLADLALIRIGLSGTPFTNKPDRLWSPLATLQGYTVPETKWDGSISHYIRRSPIWGSKAEFERLYCQMQYNGYGSKATGGQNLSYETCELECCREQYRIDSDGKWRRSRPPDRSPDKCMSLHERLKREVMHRVRLSEIEGLAEWRLTDVPVDMTASQRHVYEKLLQGVVAWLNCGSQSYEGFEIRSVLAQMTYGFVACADLRQLAMSMANKTGAEQSIIDFAGLRAGDLAHIRSREQSGKLNWLLRFLGEEANGSKVVVFTEFQKTCRIVYAELQAAGYNPAIIDGQVPAGALRDAEQQKFREDDTCRVCVGTSAAFMGLNLELASYCILYGKVSWVPQNVTQAIARGTRLSRPKELGPLMVLRLYHENSIEVWLNALIGGKATDNENVLDGGDLDSIASRLRGTFTRASIYNIFRGNTKQTEEEED